MKPRALSHALECTFALPQQRLGHPRGTARTLGIAVGADLLGKCLGDGRQTSVPVDLSAYEISLNLTGRFSRYDFQAASPMTTGIRPSIPVTGGGVS